MSDALRKYIDMCREEEIINEQTDAMLHEMANVHANTHGIDDVVIWVGVANKRHGLRVKVSNVKNKFDKNNNFVIQMPSLDYDPKQVAAWINNSIMNKILAWIKINQPHLNDYENGVLDDTLVFLDLVKVKA